MDGLDDLQRQAVLQLQELTNGSDDDAAINVLASVDWDVHRAAELIFGTTTTTPAPQPPAPTASSSRMVPFDIDDSQQGVPHHRPAAPPTALLTLIARPLLTLLAVPLHLLSGLMRLLFGVLRLPVPQLRFAGLSFLPRTLGRRAGARGAGGGGPERWLRELEEETGAISVGRAQVPRGTTSSVADAGAAAGSSLTARTGATGPASLDEGRKYLPDFVVCSYEEMLRTCQRDAKIGCVVLVSAEHDDVAEFKRSTLTDPSFVKILSENEIIVWGGDVRDQDAWSASEKLQATTYPFVAFVALQPRRSPTSNASSNPSAPPTLTVLSRHQGPCTPPTSGPTSAATLTAHLRDRLLPRVTPYLGRLAAAQRARVHERDLRAEQDAAFAAAALRDKERIERKMREERERRDAERARAEEERRETERRVREEEDRKRREAERMVWRRWTRRVIVGDSTAGGSAKGGGLRIAIRLPSGARVVHSFAPNASLTALYAAIDTQLIPLQHSPSDDPLLPPGVTLPTMKPSSAITETILEAHVIASSSGTADGYWGFKVASAYPRVEIPWRSGAGGGARLAEVEVLRGGGQVVVEMIVDERLRRRSGERERGGSNVNVNGNGNGSDEEGEDEDDGYHTEESE